MLKELPLILLILFFIFCFIGMKLAQRRGKQDMRSFPPLLAIREAISRSVEMGRPVVFEFGTIEVQTHSHWIVPGLGILREVAKICGELGAHLTAPTGDPVLVPLLEDIIKFNYRLTGRNESEVDVRYIAATGYPFAAAMMGYMEKERPATHFLFGTTMFDSIILCESAAAVGAIQIAGTAGTWQLPMMIASCDYCLIGEEYLVAGAILSNDLGQLGTIVGQDWGKALIMVLIVLGGILAQFGIKGLNII